MLRKIASQVLGWSRPFQYARHGNIALHDYEALYFPIPKVACSSLTLAVADLVGVPSPDPNNKLAFPHRRNYPYVKRSEILRLYTSYFRFAFVRNPWDRVLSCYQNKIVGVREGKFGGKVLPAFFHRDSKRFSLDMSFEDFVEILMEIPDQTADPHYRAQYTFLYDQQGVPLVNFIGRFESLAADFDYVKTRIAAPHFDLPHVMKSPRDGAYRPYYNARTAELVSIRYATDIERFEYTF